MPHVRLAHPSVIRRFLRRPIDDLMAAMEHVVDTERPVVSMALLMLSAIASWYVYVPIHELLHALGCAATGGTVTVLEIQVQYGGALLAEVFPFVQPGGEYAGRLSGFDTHGSDLTYLATDALPFSLSVLIGVPVMRFCTRARRPVWLGLGVVLGLAPFLNLPGDYYEMGSILTTAAAELAGSDGNVAGLRSDDLILLITTLASEPETLGVDHAMMAAFSIVAVSIFVAVGLAFATWALGDLLATWWIGPSRAMSVSMSHEDAERPEPSE